MKNLQVRTYTDISTEPVSASEAKLFCKVTGSADDTLFTILIKAAREALEKYTASTFAQKTLHAIWVDPPDDDIYELPYGPHISVDAVYRIDSEGTETALTLNTDYWVYGDQDLILRINKYWSTAGSAARQSVRVEFKAGYGNAATETLPNNLKLAILKEIATQYDMREDIAPSGMAELTNSAKALAAPYRKKVWF